MRLCARSNTRLFSDWCSDEAYLSAIQNAPRATARISGPQSDGGRTRGAARKAGAGSQAPRRVGSASRVLGRRKRARSHGLGPDKRLTQSAVFVRLLQHGERRSIDGYTLYLARREGGPPRLGILVTRKHSALAVERNRIKRYIREAFRLEQERLGALDVLVRPPYGARPSSQMVVRLRGLFSRLNQ
jgi:ribonuclease P protein component